MLKLPFHLLFLFCQLNYLVPATCCIIILFVFDLPAYTSPTNFPAVLALFLLYGCVAASGQVGAWGEGARLPSCGHREPGGRDLPFRDGMPLNGGAAAFLPGP